MIKYVQSWVIEGPEWSGIVYAQDIAVTKFNEAGHGASMYSQTIVRHPDGSREYLPGTIAASVQAFREGRS